MSHVTSSCSAAYVPDQQGTDHDQTSSAEDGSETRWPSRLDRLDVQRMVEDNLHLAAHGAARYRRKGVDFVDLQQVAYVGLISAAWRYRPERGEFTAFASVTISGELKKYFRDRAWSIRPPRTIQDLKTQLAAQTLRDRLSAAERSELAARYDVSVRQIDEAMSASTCYRADSLDAPTFEGGLRGDQVPDEVDEYAHVDRVVDLQRLLATLDPEDREVIVMRFFQDLTQQQIADRTGTSQMAVSRKLSQIVDNLRFDLDTDSMDRAS